MKHAILLIAVVCLWAVMSWSALPDIITDPATRDTIEYIDAKVSKIETITNSTYSATTNGFATFATGQRMQWGTFTHASGDGTAGSVIYPIAFPNATGAVVGTTIYSSGSGCFLQVYSVSKTGFSWRIGNPGNTGVCTSSYWQAVGY